jgi:hypothetical protein
MYKFKTIIAISANILIFREAEESVHIARNNGSAAKYTFRVFF